LDLYRQAGWTGWTHFYLLAACLVDTCMLYCRAAIQLQPSETKSELMPSYTFYAAGCRLQLELEEAGEEKLQAWQLLLELTTLGSAASSIRDPSSVLMDLARAMDPMAAKVLLIAARLPSSCDS
jgi:hypothetical protein